LTFIDLARRLIRKEPYEKGWSFQDEDFDVDDDTSTLKLLEMWAGRYPNNLPYALTEDGLLPTIYRPSRKS